MRKVNGLWMASAKERTKWIKDLMNKGYDNNEAIYILDRQLLEYNPLCRTIDAMIDMVVRKEATR